MTLYGNASEINRDESQYHPRDTTPRLTWLLEARVLKTAVLRAQVEALRAWNVIFVSTTANTAIRRLGRQTPDALCFGGRGMPKAA